MEKTNRMLVFNPDAVRQLMRAKGINDDDLRSAGLSESTIKYLHGDNSFKAFPAVCTKLCKVLGCRKGDITYWKRYVQHDYGGNTDDRSPKMCKVCGKIFIPFTTTGRPDGTLSVAGWDYCSFQCCEEDNPDFKKRDNRNGLENFRGHGNNFNKKDSSNCNC